MVRDKISLREQGNNPEISFRVPGLPNCEIPFSKKRTKFLYLK